MHPDVCRFVGETSQAVASDGLTGAGLRAFLVEQDL
jgi:hypothetical protein